MNPLSCGIAVVAFASVAAAPLAAQSLTPRETLIRAAFTAHDKAQALALIDQAIGATQAILARDPNNREAKLQQTLGIGYRGQLKRSPSDAKATLVALNALVASDPRDPEAQVALAGWHLTAIGDLGPFLAHTLLGASKDQGYAALSRALALGGNHAFFAGYAALIHIRLDSGDLATPLALAQRSAAAQASTPIDRILQRAGRCGRPAPAPAPPSSPSNSCRSARSPDRRGPHLALPGKSVGLPEEVGDRVDHLAAVDVDQQRIVIIAYPAIGAVSGRQTIIAGIADPVILREEDGR